MSSSFYLNLLVCCLLVYCSYGNIVATDDETEPKTDSQRLRGDTGVKGFTGSRGEPGHIGARGDTGPKGYTGNRGVPGNDGLRGSPGAPGFPGVQGPPGPKGLIGPPGINGPQGANGSSGVRISQRSPYGETERCPLATFIFPYKPQTSDYVRYRSYFPHMSSASVCAWIQSMDIPTSMFSYSTYSNDNEFLFFFISMSKAELFVGSSRTIFRFNPPLPMDTQSVHLCVWFDSASHTVGIYVDGVEHDPIPYTGSTMEGGGTFIIGQEQDTRNAGRLDGTQALRGQISNMVIYPQKLQVAEVKGVMMCKCPRGYSALFSTDRVEVWGNVRTKFDNNVACDGKAIQL